MQTTSRTDREIFTMVAILKQLEIAGIDPKVLKEDAAWCSNYSITQQQREEWKNWFIAEARKTFSLNKKLAEEEFNWFNQSYGLRGAATS